MLDVQGIQQTPQSPSHFHVLKQQFSGLTTGPDILIDFSKPVPVFMICCGMGQNQGWQVQSTEAGPINTADPFFSTGGITHPPRLYRILLRLGVGISTYR